MDESTFYSRIAALARKSKKAVTLYSSVGKSRADQSLSDRSVQIWKEINRELCFSLEKLLQQNPKRNLSQSVMSLRDIFYSRWREEEAALAQGRRELELAVENSDFMKVAKLAERLALHKAALQANRAAYGELHSLLDYSQVRQRQEELLTPGDSPAEKTAQKEKKDGAQVIPLRRRKVIGSS